MFVADALANPITTQAGSTLLVIGTLQWLKKAKWFPLLKEGQRYLTRAVSVIAALCVSVGIHYTWNPTDHSLLITGLSLYTIVDGAFHWGAQYIYQETGYTVFQALQAMMDIAEAHKQTGPNNAS